MRNVLQICRDYGHDLDWWDGLDHGMQTLYLGDFRVRVRELENG